MDLRRFVALAGLVLAVPLGSPAAVEVSAPSERTASASWIRFERVRYVVSVSESVAAGASLDGGVRAGRVATGEVVAAIELCEPDLSSCARGQTWTGELGSALTNGIVFEVDPALRTARLTGWLTEPDAGNACWFDVRWQSIDGQEPTLTGPALDPSGASATIAWTRDANASVANSCWRTSQNPDFVAGSGRIEARHGVSVAA